MKGPVFFGVRHLSPAAAFQLRKALDQAEPELVLVEGPSDLNSQMEWLCHPGTRFPAAILAYTRQPPVRTVLWPFAVYSPEIQAILWANEHGVECRFMDLPSSVFLALRPWPAPVREEDGEAEEAPTTESVYQLLETVTGEDHDTFWERNFEQLGGGEDFRTVNNTFGRQLRAAAGESRRDQAETVVREAYMKRVIAQAAASGISPEKIFCVCGSFHVAGLEENAPMTDEEERSLPRADSRATLMPYSYYRLSSRSGYGAGNRAPAYFELLWDALNGGGIRETAYLYLTRLAAAHRKAGNLVSSAEVIEAARLADTLAALRGSRYPTLSDLRNASVATMGHGSFSELALAAADTEIGKTIGFLPEGVARTSVQEDFYRQLKELRLERFRTAQGQRL
ncbi:MAG: hypothetical protein HFF27_05920, partial [Oscillospiraceae bacterium]|nr:hypothetical protein [Oscillospiraceae bacterium]